MASVFKNQLSLSKEKKPKQYLVPSFIPEIAADPFDWIRCKLRGLPREVFHELLKYYNLSGRVYASQITISEKLGIRRETVNKILQDLKAKGFIDWKRRMLTSNIYYLNPIFKDPEARKELRHTFKCFYFLPILILMPTLTAQPVARDTVKNIYIFSSSNKTHKQENRNIKVLTSTTKRPSSESDGGSKVVRKGRDMEIKRPSLLKALNFSRAGQIKVAIFPQEAQNSALAQLRSWRKPLVVSKVFGLYWSLCKQYCDTNKIYYDTKESLRNLKAEGLGFEVDCLDEQTPYSLSESHKGESGSQDKAAASGTFVRPKTGPYAEAQVPASRLDISPERDMAAKLEMTKNLLEDNEYTEWTQALLGIKDLAALRKM
jgi:predicted transcriptional regulator